MSPSPSPSPASPGSSSSRAPVREKPKARTNWKNGSPSCKECIRLKLKCSRSWPCTSCVRRGCEKICPSGTLKHRPPNAQLRILDLQSEIKELRERLAAYEGREGPGSSAFQIKEGGPPAPPSGSITDVSLPSEQCGDPHDTIAGSSTYSFRSSTLSPTSPLVPSRDLVEKAAMQIDAAAGSGVGVREEEDGTERYLGRSAGALYVCEDDGPPPSATLRLPFLAVEKDALQGLHALFPPAGEAFALFHTYTELVEWMYCPVDRAAVQAALESIYGETREEGTPARPDRIHRVAPHRLATVLMAFALALTFSFRPASESQPLFNAASALLCVPEQHFLVRHSIAAVETLHMMVSYLFGQGNSDAAKAAWPILGLCVRTACAMGLHRDSSSWGLSQAQRDNRSRIWWECATYDILQSLNFGRPYSTPTQLCDCPPPSLPLDTTPTSTQSQDSIFHVYKYRLAQTFFRVADCLASTDLPDYSVVVDLDTEIRGIEGAAPPWLRWADADFYEGAHESNLPPKQTAQQHAATLFCHKALLALHRPWFFKAVMSGSEPLLGPHAASFTACVSSARKHTRLMVSLVRRCPEAAYGWWFFMFHAYTAAVIQYTVISRVPKSILAADVRADFQASHDVIEQMAPHSAVARRALPMLRRLQERMTNPVTPEPAMPGTEATLLQDLLGSSSATEMFDISPPLLGMPGTAEVSHGFGDSFATGFELPSEAAQVHSGTLDPMHMSTMDPLIQTLLYWNATYA